MLQETNGFCELLLFQPQPAEKSYLLVGCLQNKGDLPEKNQGVTSFSFIPIQTAINCGINHGITNFHAL
jgi:hypothetical protein